MGTQVRFKGIIHHQSLLKASAARKANGQPYDKTNYSVNVLVKMDSPDFATIDAIVKAEILSKFPQLNGQLPVGASNHWFDPSIKYPELKGYMELRFATSGEYERPDVKLDTGTSILPIMDNSEIKIGNEIWVIGSVTAYDTGNGGLSCYLGCSMVTNVKGVIPVEHLSSNILAEQAFADVASGAPAPAAAPPAPAAAPAPAPEAPPVHQMTNSAGGATYETMISAGWTDVTLIEAGHMLPPGGVKPSFM